MTAPASPTLSAAQLESLSRLGEERTAGVGDVLYRVGDRRYPLIAIIEGEVAILDAAGNELVRHRTSSFLGEMNLLTGQTVFVTAVATQPLRYIEVDRDALRPLLFDDGPLSDLLLSTFIAAGRHYNRSRASASRSSARVRRRPRCRSSSSLVAIACPLRGATRSEPATRLRLR